MQQFFLSQTHIQDENVDEEDFLQLEEDSEEDEGYGDVVNKHHCEDNQTKESIDILVSQRETEYEWESKIPSDNEKNPANFMWWNNDNNTSTVPILDEIGSPRIQSKHKKKIKPMGEGYNNESEKVADDEDLDEEDDEDMLLPLPKNIIHLPTKRKIEIEYEGPIEDAGDVFCTPMPPVLTLPSSSTKHDFQKNMNQSSSVYQIESNPPVFDPEKDSLSLFNVQVRMYRIEVSHRCMTDNKTNECIESKTILYPSVDI